MSSRFWHLLRLSSRGTIAHAFPKVTTWPAWLEIWRPVLSHLLFFFHKDFSCGPFLKSLLSLLQYCFCFMFSFFGLMAHRILALQPRFKLTFPASGDEDLTPLLPHQGSPVSLLTILAFLSHPGSSFLTAPALFLSAFLFPTSVSLQAQSSLLCLYFMFSPYKKTHNSSFQPCPLSSVNSYFPTLLVTIYTLKIHHHHLKLRVFTYMNMKAIIQFKLQFNLYNHAMQVPISSIKRKDSTLLGE